MKYAGATLQSYLAGNNQFLMADLYTLTLMPNGPSGSPGTSFYWTDADTPITLSSTTFTAAMDQGGQPLITRGQIRNARGLDVQTTDVSLLTGDTAQILGIDANLAACNGTLDCARVQIQRVVMTSWGNTTMGAILLFDGYVADLEIGATAVKLTVASKLQLLQRQMPRNLILPGCLNSFGDANCGINLASFTVSSSSTLNGVALANATYPASCTAISGDNQLSLALHGASIQPDTFFQNGLVVFTSGANAGTQVAIQTYYHGFAALATPLPSPPSVGDAYTVYPGCGRSAAYCPLYYPGTTGGVPNWQTHFRGMPFVPAPITGI